jgi:hypothetical protein
MHAPLSISLILASLSLFAHDQGEWIDQELGEDFQLAMTDDTDHPSTMSFSQEAPSLQSPRPNLSKGTHLLFSGELLYWKPQSEGLKYALQSPNFTSYIPFMNRNDPTKGIDGKAIRMESKYQPGYRLNATYQIPHDQWDLTFSWMRFKADDHQKTPEKPGNVLFMDYADSSYNSLALSAKARWALNLNQVGLDLSRSFSLNRSFSLRVSGGFRAAWIEQLLNLHFYNFVFNNGLTIPDFFSKNRSHFAGYGMDVGIDGKWSLPYGFYLFGKCATTLFFGKFKLDAFEKAQIQRKHIKEKESMVVPEIEIQGGAGWEYQFPSNRCYLRFYAAFEEQVWIDQNQFLENIDSRLEWQFANALGDLTFAGWTVGVTLGF